MRTVLGVLAGVGVFLAVGEAASRFVLSRDHLLQRIDSGTSSSRRITSVHRVAALGRMPFFEADAVVFDPELGHRARPMDAMMEDAGVTNRYTVDAEGRRATAPVGAVPPAGAPVIALLGDSFTFGDEVGDADTFGWLLRKATAADVRNHGVLGYGLDQVWLQWRRDVAPASPDVVVVVLTDAVVFRTGLPWDNWAKPWVTVDGGALEVHGVPVPPPETFLPSAWSPRLLDVVDLWRARGLRRTELQTALEAAPAVLDALADEVAAAGAALVVVFAPVPSDYQAQPPMPSAAHDQVFVPWCEAAGPVLCIDLLDAFRAAQADGVALTRVNHWSPEGHALVAGALTDALVDEGLATLPGAASAQRE